MIIGIGATERASLVVMPACRPGSRELFVWLCAQLLVAAVTILVNSPCAPSVDDRHGDLDMGADMLPAPMSAAIYVSIAFI